MANRFWTVKIWGPITLLSLLAHTIYWNLQTIEQTYLNFPGPYFSNAIPAAGSILRIIGILTALSAIYLAWGPRGQPFSAVKSKISAALFLEAAYYSTFMPTAIYLIIELSPLQGALYSLFTLLMAPLLIILSFKVQFSQKYTNTGVLRWTGAACLGYLIALWVITGANWIDAVWTFGIQFITTGTAYVNFFNSLITLSLALLFALLAILPIINKGITSSSTKKWGSLSMVMLGTYFAIYVLHAALTGSLNAALIGDIWLIPLLGLGPGLLKMGSKN